VRLKIDLHNQKKLEIRQKHSIILKESRRAIKKNLIKEKNFEIVLVYFKEQHKKEKEMKNERFFLKKCI